jgi:hypothetical protein
VPYFSFIFRSTALTPFRYAHSSSPRPPTRSHHEEHEEENSIRYREEVSAFETTPAIITCLESYVPSLAIFVLFVSFVVQNALSLQEGAIIAPARYVRSRQETTGVNPYDWTNERGNH